MPVFGIRTLLTLAVPVAIAAAILGVMSTRGAGVFKKQGVAWGLTLLMVLAAVGIGYSKANAAKTPGPNPPSQTPPVQTIPPAANSCVWDDARVLSDKTERTLDQRNDRLWNNYGVTVGVVTCDYGGDDLYEYTVETFGEMGLGGGDMLVVLDISGDNYGLYAGSSVSRHFSDQDCSDYAYDYMEDFFARGMYDDAVLALTEVLEAWYGAYYG